MLKPIKIFSQFRNKKQKIVTTWQEHEFRSLVENSEDIITRYNRDLERIYANPAYLKLSGFNSEEVLGIKIEKKTPLPIEVANSLRDLLKKVFNSGLPDEMDMEWTHPQRGYICFSLQAVPEFDKKGKVESVMTIARDITKRKETERQLKETQNRLNTIFSTIPDLVWLKDVNGVYLGCNKAFEGFFGATEAEITGKTDYDFVDAGLADFFRTKDNEAIQAEKVCINEETITYASNGKQGLLETRKVPVYDANGKIAGVLGIGRDITDRKNAEMLLTAREQELRTLTENIPDAIFRYNRQCQRIYVNPVVCRILGREAGELLDNTPRDGAVVEEKQNKIITKAISDVFLDGLPRKIDVDFINPDGKHFEYDFFLTPEYDTDGNIATVLGVGRDITERKIAEKMVAQREREFRTLVENTRDIIIRYNKNCQRVYVNPAYYKLCGFIPVNTIGFSLVQFSPLPTEIALELLTKVKDVLFSGVQSQMEIEWTDNEGVFHCYHAHITPEFDDKQSVTSVLLVAHDISDKKETEKALQKEQFRLSEAQRIGQIGSWELNHSTGLITFSSELKRIYELDPERYTSTYERFITMLVHPEDREFVETSFKKSIHDNVPCIIDHRIVFPNGHVKYLFQHCETIKDSSGNPVLTRGTVQDITTRKLSEIALIESEQKVRRKLESVLSPDTDFSELELSDILDSVKLQALADEFCKVSKVALGIIDTKGKILAKGAWQDVCTKFHRANSESCKRCVESDIVLSQNVPAGTFKQYRCKNNMWDIATPIIIGGRHMGNIFVGQFMYDDETIEKNTFIEQARLYGYNQQEYLAALDKVPRVSRETIHLVITFLASFADIISKLSYSNLKLANMLEKERLMENEIRRQAEFQQVLLNGVRDVGITIMVNNQGKITFSNDLYQGHLLGYNKGEMSDTPHFLEFVHPDDHQKIFDIYKRRMAGEDSPFAYEIGALTKQGERREYEMSVAPIPGTEPKQMVVFAKDITERIEAVEKLKDKQAKLEEAQRIGRIGSWELDIKSGKPEWSPELYRIFEIDPVLFNPTCEAFQQVIHPDDRERVNQAFARAEKNNTPIDIDYRLLFPDGRIKYVSGHTITYFDNAGNPIQSIGTVRDMTRRKNAELELLKAKEKAEESNRLKAAFLATMNHELRTPLNHILGFSELLKFEPDKAAKYGQIIQSSGQHLLGLIEDILKLAMADQTGITSQNQTIKLADLYSQAKQTLTEILENSGKNRKIELRFKTDLAMFSKTISADQNKINQVLGNLFKNAVKFTENGHIEFGMSSDRPGWLNFYIQDTGIGIPVEKQHMVFGFFNQVEDSHTRTYGGIGVGLTISKKIAEVLKGTLTFISEPGLGSTFYFSFPFEGISPVNQHQVPDLLHNYKGRTILVVDDDKLSMKMMNLFLTPTGATIIEAANGLEAIEKFNPSIDLILMDLRMPVLDGYKATREIKSVSPDVPVIAISAYALPTDKPKAIEAGCNSIISKPVNREILFAEINRSFVS